MKTGFFPLLLGMICFGYVFVSTAPASSVEVPMITKDELRDKLYDPTVVVIDVRSDEDWSESPEKIKGATHEAPDKVPVWSLGEFFTYDRDNTYVFYCASPGQEISMKAAISLMELGFTNVFVLEGGWNEWKKAGYPVQSK